MQELIQSLQKKHAERGYLLATLDMWAKVRAQGIDPDTVKSFGFDESKVEPKWRRAARMSAITGSPHPYLDSSKCPRYHNYVRLHDNTRTKLNPPVQVPRRGQGGQS